MLKTLALRDCVTQAFSLQLLDAVDEPRPVAWAGMSQTYGLVLECS